jgi:hypothetical protein
MIFDEQKTAVRLRLEFGHVALDHFGYTSAFLGLAAAAAAALTVFALGMPETADRATVSLPSRQTHSG